MIVVLGAGLTGLSTAFHLRDMEYLVFERERAPGGLARSATCGAFFFDFAGHVLHFKDEYVLSLLDDLLGDDQLKIHRSAWVRFQDRLVPYPFQAHTHALPEAVRLECLRAFADTLVAPPTGGDGRLELPFTEWAEETFGAGFARHFFLPYTRKSLAADPATLTSEWAAGVIPRPDLEDVLRGALGIPNRTFGYNPIFRYPASGAIQRLPSALARRIRPVQLARSVVRIDSRARTIRLLDGETIPYRSLVSTIPLPELIGMVEDIPEDLRRAAKELRWCSIACFNFGIDGKLGHGRHWTYYPEPKYDFYRVGYPSNLSPRMAPRRMSSLCAEVAYPSHSFPPEESAQERILEQLVDAGELLRKDCVVARSRLDLPFAKVLFDRRRREILPGLFAALRRLGIHPAGCFGTWDYLSMEESILQGKQVADMLRRIE
ncbi:MAG: FAD-dependent oxidoreductase [Planctomycetota bacterium]